MHYSISTYTLFHLSIDQAIERLIHDGWKSIEVMGEGKYHGRPLLYMEQMKLKEIASLVKKNNVSLGFHLPVTGFNPASVDESTETIWAKCLSIMEVIDVNYVLLHPGTNTSIQAGIESTALFIKKMLRDLPEMIKIVIENIPYKEGSIGTSIEELISIIDHVNDDRVGIMLDTGHCYMNAQEHFLKECEKAFPYLYGLHINDNHGQHDEHLQIGEGVIPFKQFFLRLGKRDIEYVLETNTIKRAEHSKLHIEKFLTKSTRCNLRVSIESDYKYER